MMWENFDQFAAGTSFAAWGCRIAKYRLLRYFQKQKRGGCSATR